MNRRKILKGGIGVLVLGNVPAANIIANTSSSTDAANIVDYTAEIYQDALASGEPFLLDFYAAW